MLYSKQDRIDAQYELEVHSVQEGIARYRQALQDDGLLSVAPGKHLIKAAMEPMVGALKKWLEETSQGLASRSAGVFYFIDQSPPEAVAWITARVALNMLHMHTTLAKAATSLAVDIETYVNFTAIEKSEPALGRKLERVLKKMNAGRNRAVFVRRGGALSDVKVIQWDDSTRLRVGTLLLQMFAESTGLVTIELQPMMHNRWANVIRATESCLQWLEKSHERCELLSPFRLPMLCQPREWWNPYGGGYLTKELRQALVKTNNRGYLETLKQHEMPWVYATVNALQATTWAINRPIYETLKALWENGVTVGEVLPPRDPAVLPGKSWAEGEEPDPEVLQQWKASAAIAHGVNRRADSKRLQTVQKLWISEQMMERGDNRFHFVYNLDWRGRIYPVGPSLTPQGDDVAKGLLQFADGTPLGDEGAYWLAVHGANSFGVDKVSFDERIAWVEEHTADIEACGADPLASTWWQEAGSPFVFLAFCVEWALLQRHVDRGLPETEFISALPVAFDGSCNGLQNFSAMLRDEVGGKATGLVPGERPADIYSEVAKATQVLIDRDAAEPGDNQEVAKRWVGKMTRQLAKRNTMTVPYGVTRRGMRDQLFAELKDGDTMTRNADATYLAACNYEAIGGVVVAARAAMDWLKESAKVASKSALPINWTTPAGLLVRQDYRDDVGDEYDFTVLGRRFHIMFNRQGDKLNPRRQAMGISPNFVHSLDAAHLMRTVLFCVEDGMTEFAMVHDSYGVPAGHAARLRVNLREAFVAQYEEPVLQQFREELLAQLPPELHAELPELPAMGTLDLEQVRDSEYFFA